MKTYPELIRKCYNVDALDKIGCIASSGRNRHADSYACRGTLLVDAGRRSCGKPLTWDTAQWQYILPRKTKKNSAGSFCRLSSNYRGKFAEDMALFADTANPRRRSLLRAMPALAKAYRTISLNWCYVRRLIPTITITPTPRGWKCRSCGRSAAGAIYSKPLGRNWCDRVPSMCRKRPLILKKFLLALKSSRFVGELSEVCRELAEVRLTRGGKKTYHLMVACYFLDLAHGLEFLAESLQFAFSCMFRGWRFRPLRRLRAGDEMVGGISLGSGLQVVLLRTDAGAERQMEKPKTPRTLVRGASLGRGLAWQTIRQTKTHRPATNWAN